MPEVLAVDLLQVPHLESDLPSQDREELYIRNLGKDHPGRVFYLIRVDVTLHYWKGLRLYSSFPVSPTQLPVTCSAEKWEGLCNMHDVSNDRCIIISFSTHYH